VHLTLVFIEFRRNGHSLPEVVSSGLQHYWVPGSFPNQSLWALFGQTVIEDFF